MLQELDEKKKEAKANNEDESTSDGALSPSPSKIGFESLAKMIGSKWQQLTPSQVGLYKEKALVDMKRYKSEMEIYSAKQLQKQQCGTESQKIATVKNEGSLQESENVSD
jgi:hypothetical protein